MYPAGVAADGRREEQDKAGTLRGMQEKQGDISTYLQRFNGATPKKEKLECVVRIMLHVHEMCAVHVSMFVLVRAICFSCHGCFGCE